MQTLNVTPNVTPSPDRRSERRLLMTPEAARLVGLSPRTLETFRCRGCGPVFRKIGGRVVYALEDLQSWVDRAACRSTSEENYETARTLSRRWRTRP